MQPVLCYCPVMQPISNVSHFVYCSPPYSVYQYIPSSILAGFIEGKEINSERQLSLIVVATSNRNLDVIMKSPKVCQINSPFIVNDSDVPR